MAKTAEQLAKQAEHELNNYDGPTPVLGDVLLALANACLEEAAQLVESPEGYATITNQVGETSFPTQLTKVVARRIRALKSPAPGPAKKGGGK